MSGRRLAYVVTHCEFMKLGRNAAYVVDEMPHFVAGSLRRAVQLMRRSFVDPGSWWKVYLVSDDGPERWWTYSRRGLRLRSDPKKQGLRVVRRRDQKRRAGRKRVT
jgi:hypothetical protein